MDFYDYWSRCPICGRHLDATDEVMFSIYGNAIVGCEWCIDIKQAFDVTDSDSESERDEQDDMDYERGKDDELFGD